MSSQQLHNVDIANEQQTRRRPAVRVACRWCISRKVKCDAGRPSCSTCTKRRLECVYDTTHEDESRTTALKRRIRSLERRIDHLHAVMCESCQVRACLDKGIDPQELLADDKTTDSKYSRERGSSVGSGTDLYLSDMLDVPAEQSDNPILARPDGRVNTLSGDHNIDVLQMSEQEAFREAAAHTLEAERIHQGIESRSRAALLSGRYVVPVSHVQWQEASAMDAASVWLDEMNNVGSDTTDPEIPPFTAIRREANYDDASAQATYWPYQVLDGSANIDARDLQPG